MANYLERLDGRGNLPRRKNEDLARIDYVNLLGSFPAHHLVFAEASAINGTFLYIDIRDEINPHLLHLVIT